MPGSHYSCVWSVWTDRVVWDVLERLQHLGTRRKQHQQLPNPPRQILCVEVKLLTSCTLHGHTRTILLFHLSHLYYKCLCIREHFWRSHPPQGFRGPSRCWDWAVWSRPASPAGRTAWWGVAPGGAAAWGCAPSEEEADRRPAAGCPPPSSPSAELPETQTPSGIRQTNTMIHLCCLLQTTGTRNIL